MLIAQIEPPPKDDPELKSWASVVARNVLRPAVHFGDQ
jgi:hypothetical protein